MNEGHIGNHLYGLYQHCTLEQMFEKKTENNSKIYLLSKNSVSIFVFRCFCQHN